MAFGMKRIAALEAELASSRREVERLERDKAVLNELIFSLRSRVDVLDARAEERAARIADLQASNERISRAEREAADVSTAMRRFAAQMDVEVKGDEEEEEESPVMGLQHRIHEIYGDNPKPPPNTVWARDLLKEPQSGEEV